MIGEIDAYPEAGEPHGDETAPKDTFSPCWMLNLNYTGKGYAYEAAHAFFDYLFREKGARRIYAYTEDYNLPSQRLCKKLGMRREGLFREFITFVNNPDGTPLYENTYQYAILKKEWDLLFLAHVGDLEKIMFWAFVIGNVLYYAVGIALAFAFKDNRAFCKYLCPITVFLKPMSYFALFRVQCDKEKCISCGKCRRVCPMDVDVTDNSRKRKNGTECILCMECVKNCPKGAL